MLRELVVLLCLLGAADALLVKFRITGTFSCPLPHFQYHAVVVEDDLFYDDYLSNQGPQFGSMNTRYEIEAKDNEGDGWFDNHYEIWLKVFHTCNDGSGRRYIWFDLGSFPIVDGHTYERTRDFSLYNRGERTIEFKRHLIMPAAPFNATESKVEQQ